MSRVRLDTIAFDAGTQIRAAINEPVVAEYAERMAEGVAFPPIVLFNDGTAHYLADGFHRYLASQRVGFADIDADVRAGTKQDAVWFGLGANCRNGVRLTLADKKHAIQVAIAMWPNKPQHEIAKQVGCSQQFVSQVTATSEVLREPHQFAKISTEKADAIERELRQGKSVREIAKTLKASVHTVARIRDTRAIAPKLYRSSEASSKRREQMRTMATEGYTSRQIAASVGLSGDRVRDVARREGIDISADRAVGKTFRHNANRIVNRIVMDAENLTEGVDLIDFSAIDRSELAGWLASLKKSRDQLGGFIRRLMQEQSNNGEAA